MYLSRSEDGATNPRGIPVAPFVEKVEDYVSSRKEVEATLKNFQEMISYVTKPPHTTRIAASVHDNSSLSLSLTIVEAAAV